MQSESHFHDDELEVLRSNLESLISQNRDRGYLFIPLLAFRAAVRALPLISVGGASEYGMNVEGSESRFRYLNGLMLIVCMYTREMDEFTRSDVLSHESEVTREAAERTSHEIISDVSRAMSYSASVYDYFYRDKNRIGSGHQDKIGYQSKLIDTAIKAFSYSRKAVPDKKVFIDAIKADVSKVVNDTKLIESEFISAPLWAIDTPWFSVATKDLEHLINELRKDSDRSADWRSIDLGLAYIKSQMDLKSKAENSGFISDLSAVRQSQTLLSFESSHESHPDNPAKIDKLNRQKLVSALATNLVNPTNNHHRAIGLLGEWGSGKSTVLDLLKQRLKELSSEQPYIFGEFNAWAYEHTDNIQAGVAQEMINALTGSPDVLQPLYPPTASFFEKLKKVLSSDVRKIFAAILDAIPVSSNMSLRWFSERCTLTIRFAYKVHPVELLKILLLLLVAAMPWFSEWFQELIEFSESSNNRNSWIWTGGVFLYTLREFGKLIISPQAKELLTYLRLPSYAEHLGTIPVMRKHICTLCNLRLKQKNGKTPRLLFVVDDLDRCSPSAIVKVLEAVRLVLDLDNVIVIIAIDQHIALAALSEHFKDFSPHHKLKNSHAIAREYLSKVINLPIVLTKPSSDDVRMFMGSFWEEMNKTVEREVNESKSKLEISDTSNVSENSGVSTAGDDRLDVRNITQHASAEGDRVPGALATDTVDLDGSEQSNAEVDPPPMMKPVKALSKDQQESFIYWVNYFDLSNSRQLKRLNNSYDLMRSYVPLMDKEVFEFEFAESAVSKVYPMLLTLILMEYLNSLHDLKERNQLWDQLFRDSSVPIGEVVSNRLVSMEFIKAYRRLLVSEVNQSLVSNVEAFVLPAMT